MDLPAFMMSGVVPGVAVLTTWCWVTPDGPMSTKHIWVPDEVVITKSSYIMVFLSIFVGNFGHVGPKKGELPGPQVCSVLHTCLPRVAFACALSFVSLNGSEIGG